MTDPDRSTSNPSPRILVVDDDRRVRDLLEIALAAQGFAVVTARDGEEAVRIALGDPVDLVVLDVRLPRKSGLEVCDVLRASAEDPWIPIIMVSAASETDARLQGFSRGADDYLGKPFSPKELIARIRRLLARAVEQREARGHARSMERETQRARDDARRARIELERLREGRDLVVTLSGELLGAPDLDALCRRLLDGVRTRLGTPVAGLLLPAGEHGVLDPAAVRGDGFWRIAPLTLDPDGALARRLTGLGRPATVQTLAHGGDAADAAPFVAARFDLLVPLRDDGGLTGLLVIEERPDASHWSAADLDALATTAEVGARALRAALAQRTLVAHLLDAWALRGPQDAFTAAAAAAAAHAGHALALPPPLPELVRFAVRAGTMDAEARGELERLAARDTTALARRLASLLDRVGSGPADDTTGDEARAAALVSAALRHAEARRGGVPGPEALDRAFDAGDPSLDAGARAAFESAIGDPPDARAHAA